MILFATMSSMALGHFHLENEGFFDHEMCPISNYVLGVSFWTR